jgi:hypothetical protein
MGRKKKTVVPIKENVVAVQETSADVEFAAPSAIPLNEPIVKEQKVEKKVDELKLYKTIKKDVATKFILEGCNIAHISGCGTNNSPKIWFIESYLKTVNKMEKDELCHLEDASYDEIDTLIGKSIDRSNLEMEMMGLRKPNISRKPMPSRTF